MMSRLAQRRKNRLTTKPKRKINFNKILKFSVILGVLALLVVVLISTPKLVTIKDISCTSQFGPCNQKIREVLDNLQGNNFFEVRNKLKDNLSQNLYIDSYNYNLKLPQAIDLEIKERKPQIAVVKQTEMDKYYLMDESGLVIDKGESSVLPILIVKQDINFNVGDNLPESVTFAAKVLKQVFNVYNINLVTLEPDGVVVESVEDKIVVFPLNGDINELFGGLSLILSRLNTEQNVSKIDLRFKNPVLN